MTFLFFLMIFLILSSYIAYPIILMVMGTFAKKRVLEDDSYEPSVSMLIAAYNEEENIEDKILNSLELDYPKDKFQIVVVSDGSTDQTDQIVKRYEPQGVKLFRVEGRVGKTQARNVAVLADRSDVILFSDATAMYEKNVVRELVKKLADPTVGMVSGSLKYFDRQGASMGIATKLYWKYESFIKSCQGKLYTMTGAVGCINAFKRNLYYVLPANIIEDFTEPLMIISQVYRVAYAPNAISYERTTQKVKQEFNMRCRVIRGGMTGFLFALKSLTLKDHSYALVQLFFHKVMRWLMPVNLILLYLINLAIVATGEGSFFFSWFFYAQTLFYLVAFLGLFFEAKNKMMKIILIPTYFLVVNLASLKAMYLTLTTKLSPTWETNVY